MRIDKLIFPSQNKIVILHFNLPEQIDVLILVKNRWLIYLLLVVCAMPLFAQDESYYEPFTLPQPPEGLISPEILPDNRVVFRLYAPDAISVSVNSDCFGRDIDTTPFGSSKGTVQLEKDSLGVWSYKTKYPVYPNCYTYDYLVDYIHNVIDPANPEDAWNQGSHFSVFAVGGDDIADLFIQSDVPHGEVQVERYFSDCMGHERRMAIYLPPNYDSVSHTYPVLYLLHGISGDEMAWLSLGRVAQICDNMIAKKIIEPMVVVMPNCNVMISNEEDGATTLTENILNIPKQLSGFLEECFYELTDYVDSHYSISPLQSDRSIAGLSSGGHQAANLAIIMPNYFGSIGLFSATLWKKNVPTVSATADSPYYYIYVGKNDWVSWSLSQKTTRRLEKRGYHVDVIETHGGHAWKWWRNYLIRYILNFDAHQKQK